MAFRGSPFELQHVPHTPVQENRLQQFDAIVPNRPDTPMSPKTIGYEAPSPPGLSPAMVTPVLHRRAPFFQRPASAPDLNFPPTPGTRLAQIVPSTPVHLSGTIQTPFETPDSSSQPQIAAPACPVKRRAQTDTPSRPDVLSQRAKARLNGGIKQINLFGDDDEIFA